MTHDRPTLIFARHAPVTPDYEGRCYGATDATVVMPAEDAAREILERLRGGEHAALEGQLRAVHSSPLSRCLEPATLLAETLQLPLEVNPALKELDHGEFEGRAWEEIHANSLDELASWGVRWLEHGPPGGESALLFQARVERWLRSLDPGGPALVVGHAGVWRALTVIVDPKRTWDDAMASDVRHLTPVLV